MQDFEHVEILCAYLNRLTLADIENIAKTNRAWTMAALNYGAGEQDKARAAHHAAVCNAVNNLLKHDKANIASIVTRVTDKVAV